MAETHTEKYHVVMQMYISFSTEDSRDWPEEERQIHFYTNDPEKAFKTIEAASGLPGVEHVELIQN